MDELYMTFDEALQELGISESELRAMITRGQLRVFGKPGEEMFRRSAIENLKHAGETQPTIILPDEDDPADQLLPLADDDSDEPFGLVDETAEQPALMDDGTDDATELVMPTIELTDDAPPLDEEHTDVATQEVSLADDDYLILEDDKSAGGGMGRRGNRYGAPKAKEEVEAAEEELAPVIIEDTRPQPLMSVVLGVLCIAMVAAVVVFVSVSRGDLPPDLVETFENLGRSLGLI